jgi:hypothetical protein
MGERVREGVVVDGRGGQEDFLHKVARIPEPEAEGVVCYHVAEVVNPVLRRGLPPLAFDQVGDLGDVEGTVNLVPDPGKGRKLERVPGRDRLKAEVLGQPENPVRQGVFKRVPGVARVRGPPMTSPSLWT